MIVSLLLSFLEADEASKDNFTKISKVETKKKHEHVITGEDAKKFVVNLAHHHHFHHAKGFMVKFLKGNRVQITFTDSDVSEIQTPKEGESKCFLCRLFHKWFP